MAKRKPSIPPPASDLDPIDPESGRLNVVIEAGRGTRNVPTEGGKTTRNDRLVAVTAEGIPARANKTAGSPVFRESCFMHRWRS